jgi:hypothetical protein
LFFTPQEGAEKSMNEFREGTYTPLRGVQNAQTMTFFRFKQPIEPPLSISLKFEEIFLLVASMGDMPNIVRNVVHVCSCHIVIFVCFSA